VSDPIRIRFAIESQAIDPGRSGILRATPVGIDITPDIARQIVALAGTTERIDRIIRYCHACADEGQPDAACLAILDPAPVDAAPATAPGAGDDAAEAIIGEIIDKTHPDFSDEAGGFRAESRAILAAIRAGKVPGVYCAPPNADCFDSFHKAQLDTARAECLGYREALAASDRLYAACSRERDQLRAEVAALKARKVET